MGPYLGGLTLRAAWCWVEVDKEIAQIWGGMAAASGAILSPLFLFLFLLVQQKDSRQTALWVPNSFIGSIAVWM